MKKILVIEDDTDIADIVEMALQHLYTVRTQGDNSNIMASFKGFKPDLILLDNYIGQKQAPEIIGEIKSNTAYKNIPFVLFSGHHDIKRLAEEMEANAYLAKPFDLDELYLCIDTVLRNCA